MTCMFLKITIIYQNNNNNNNVKPPKLGLMEKMQLRHKTKISSPGPSLVVQSLRLHAYSVNEKETGRYFTGERCFIKGIFAFAYILLWRQTFPFPLWNQYIWLSQSSTAHFFCKLSMTVSYASFFIFFFSVEMRGYQNLKLHCCLTALAFPALPTRFLKF